jgi:hypothetical protein
MFSERRLADIVRNEPGQFWTDPATYTGALWLLSLDGNEGRVHASPPPPGGYYVFNTKPRRPLPQDWPIKTTPAGWTVLDSYTEPQRLGVRGLQAIGVWRLLPGIVVRKLAPEPRKTLLLRSPPAESN